MPSADYATSGAADKKKTRKRKYHVPAEFTGKDLVMAELLRRGFDAELAGASYEKHDMFVWVCGSRPKPIKSGPCIRLRGTCAGISLLSVRIR
jgi:hypothetical protein